MVTIKTPVVKAFLRYKKKTISTDGTLTVTKYSNDETELEIPKLTNLQLSNGEGERSSTIQITFIDENHTIDNILLNRALTDGGLAIPTNLLSEINREKEDSENLGESLLNVAGAYKVPPEGTKGDELAVAIIKYCIEVGVTDVSHIASILGNIEIETRLGLYTEEIGGSKKRYAPYYGRGLIQITWKDNYIRFGDFYGRDWVNNPEEVKQLKYAIPIAVGGMTGVKGSPTFTGYKLSDFGSGASFDFKGARRTVNGTDKNSLVASASKKWLKRIPNLKEVRSDAFSNVKIVKEGNVPIDPIPESAIEIRVQIGWGDEKELFTSSFWYTARQTSSTLPPTTTLSGRGVRFLINKTNRRNYDLISLRQLSKRIQDEYGIEITLPNDSSVDNSVNVKQTGTDFNLLNKVSKFLGFEVTQKDTNPPSLTLHRYKNVGKIDSEVYWKGIFNSSLTASSFELFSEYPTIDSIPDNESIGESFPSSIEINYPDFKVLSIIPGTILNLVKDTIPNLKEDSYYREYKVKAVNINWSATLKVTLDLYVPVRIADDDKILSPNIDFGELFGSNGDKGSTKKGTNLDFYNFSNSFVGKEFKPNKHHASMQWVREMLTEANHLQAGFVSKVSYDNFATNKNTPNSLSGTDAGTFVPGAAFYQPGDLIHYNNTWGNFKKGTITEVAVYAGNNEIIYRDSTDGVVKKIPITDYNFDKISHVVRLNV